MRSFKLRDVIDWEYDIRLTKEEERQYYIKESDTALFRMVRRISGDERKYNPYIVFVDCGGVSDYQDAMHHLVFDGITINGHKFLFGERSASMTRRGIVSFVDEDLFDEVEKRIRMDIKMDKTVLSKWYAYRGLFFSSCHNLEGFMPKVVVVSDLMVTIPQQRIKYVVDNKLTFTNDKGEDVEYLQKNVAEDVRDIDINAFDGCGIIHPSLATKITEMIGEKYPITSMIVRAPYIKGCIHAVDYESFFNERGVDFIKDIWGRWHDVHEEPMMIIGESMYKGLKYFKKYGDSRDWDLYWDKFDEYDHCWGVAKYNFSFEQEPVYTRGNYQILQDLDMEYEDFRHLADYTMRWLNDVIDSNDPFYAECLLGLTGDVSGSPVAVYVKAIAANPMMAKEKTVRDYIIRTVSKYIDDSKCGKLYLKGSFKLLSPDLVAFMEHMAGLPVVGCLESDEFYAACPGGNSTTGERLVERNPHLSASEHVILRGKDDVALRRYFSHLANVCMINIRSITPQRLNGADYDGDLVLLLDEPDMMRGVRRDLPSVIDVEDKITALSEEDTAEGRYALTLRTMKSLIGEYSNYASVYHNKCPQTEEQKKKYMDYVSIISVITGKSIDSAKTGVIFYMPKFISKYGRPLPWFMRYRSEYYYRQKLSRAPSNMNRLCWDIERWQKQIRWKRTYKDFDYGIMLRDMDEDPEIKLQIEQVYADFCKEMRELAVDQARIRNGGVEGISKYDAAHFVLNWGEYYEKYRQKCREICPDVSLLANICVRLYYEDHPSWNPKFMWIVADDGILKNLHRDEFVNLPVRSETGKYEYLGRGYDMISVVPDGAEVELVDEDEMMEWKEDMFD